MELTRERKVLIAVAGLAAAAVVGDRLLMGGEFTGPQSASAGVSAAVGDQAGPTPDLAAVVADPTPAFTGRSIAQRLDDADQETRTSDAAVPDPFAPSNLWLSESAQGSAAVPLAFEPREFVQRHPLDAVTAKGDTRFAIVAGKLMKAGDAVEGVKLEHIGDRFVVWDGHGQRFRVSLKSG